MSRPIDADEAKRIAEEYLTDPYHVISAVAVIDKTPTLTPPNEAEKAIQRLGDFGKLFLDYSGCPRGPMGEPGGSTIEEWVTMMEPICDVDGGWWRPVPEKALQILLCEMRSLKQAVPPDHFPDSTKMVQGRPNEPLTLEELRKMDGEPAWWDDGEGSCWGIISVDSAGMWGGIPFFRGRWRQVNFKYNIEERKMRIYRRPPERQEDIHA